MPKFRLLLHKDYERSIRNLPSSIRQKALWAQVLLGTRGRTPSVKSTSGFSVHWRRTPVQGNHFYMWWVPQSDSGLNGEAKRANNGQSILIHSVRHHDETNAPIELGFLDDYQEVHVASLDPRFEEQRRVSEQVELAALASTQQQRTIALSTVKGQPGSGKTISLLYLVRDVLKKTGSGKILYITYTPRLKKMAEEFLLAQDESFAERVRFRTLSEIQSEFTGIRTSAEPFQALDDFSKFLNLQNTSTLGAWRRYPHALYTEIRAHLLGREFPQGYRLLGKAVGEKSTRLLPLDAKSYGTLRNLDPEAANIAYKVSLRAAASRFFQEQKAAQHALKILISGKMPVWLPDLSGIIVDEVQDLTLLQIALLGEMVRTAVDVQSRRQSEAVAAGYPFVFTVAGDESQVVQPTGFDWGVTKDILGLQLEVKPEEFEFQHQRRSPKVLAHLIEASWNLYGYLPKLYRPSARHDAFIDESVAAEHAFEDAGRVLLCEDVAGYQLEKTAATRSATGPDPVTALVEQIGTTDWTSLFEEMVNKPGRVLIDLTENLRSVLSANAVEMGNEVLFLPREIKGLERPTVIIFGLNAVYEKALRLCDEGETNNIPRFEARRLFDEIRVSLSRSTHSLVLVEPSSAPVLPLLGIDPELLSDSDAGLARISWEDLLDILRTEEMSEVEAIEGYLDEVDDLVERRRWAWAYRRNRRAHALAAGIADVALQRDAENQYIEVHIQESAHLFSRSEWAEAYARNRDAHRLALDFGDPVALERIEEQLQQFHTTLSEQVELLCKQSQKWIESKSYKIAHRDAKAAYELADAIQDGERLGEVGRNYVDICALWAYQLTDKSAPYADVEEAKSLLQEVIDQARKNADPAFHFWQIVLARYIAEAQVGQLSAQQLERVLVHIDEWVSLSRQAEYATLTHLAGTAFVLRWLEEVYGSLNEHLLYFYDWAHSAARVIARLDATDFRAYTWSFDDYLWDLEHRVEQQLAENPQRSKRVQQALDRFKAFLLGYHGHKEEASLAWERLGNYEEAGRQARLSGQLERAYNLLRRSDSSIPEALAVAVKALRLLDQLKSKHEDLTPAEKDALLEQLSSICEMFSGSQMGEILATEDDSQE